GRNNFLYRAGRSMKAKGFGPEAIRGALEATNRTSCKPPLGEDEFEAILKSVLTQPDGPDFKGAESAEADQQQTDTEDSAGADSIKALNVRALLELVVAPREYILDPVLRTRETGMLFAWRGTGKT